MSGGNIKLLAFAASVALSASLAISKGACEPRQTDVRLVNLLMKIGLRDKAGAWCGGELQPGRTDVYAIDVHEEHGEGKYLVVADGMQPVLLAAFSGQAALGCLSPTQAREQDEVVRNTEGIGGSLTPIGNTTVVCGFVDESSVRCWQFSPDTHTFVEVGGWVT